MTGLLRANFARLWKTKPLWLGIILPSVYNLLDAILLSGYYEIYNFMRNTNDASLFFSTIFAVLYIGTDHSDKTIRNKIIVGVSRIKVYFANLITVSAGMSVIFAGNWLVMTVYSLINGGWLKYDMGQMAMYMAICLCAGVAMAAVCTLIAMLVSSKALAAVLAIALFIGLYYSRQLIMHFKTAPVHTTQMQDDADGNHIVVDEYYDSKYVVSEGVYNASQIAYNFFPESQIGWADSMIGHLQLVFGELVLYSLAVTSAASVVGVLAFRKKDLK